MLAFLGALLLVLLLRLNSIVISDMDEGTYLYQAKLLAEGLLPYRDFFVAHPPVLLFFAAGLWKLFGPHPEITRFVYTVAILGSCLPLYLLAIRITRTRLCGFLAVIAYTSGMLLESNMGRTVRLEPFVNGLVIAGFVLTLTRNGRLDLRFLAGIFFALAIGTKLVAAVPISLLFVSELVWASRSRLLVARSWLVVATGLAAILLPALVILLNTPNFIDDVITSQFARPSAGLSTRLDFVAQDVIRYPLMAVALIGSIWLSLRDTRLLVRTISLTLIATSLILIFAFKQFYSYYLVLVMPWVAIIVTVCFQALMQRLSYRLRTNLTVSVIVLLGFAIPAAYSEVYYRRGTDHVTIPAHIVEILREEEGYMYTSYPGFAIWSGRELYPWYYSADALLSRLTGHLNDEDYLHVVEASSSLVLYPNEFQGLAKTERYIDETFLVRYSDDHYTVLTRPH